MEDVGEDQEGGVSSRSDYETRENQWDEAWPGGSEEEAVHPPGEIDNLDEETGFPDVVGTTDVLEAVRDAEPYEPPVDPPVLPGGREAIETGVGFGTSVEEEAARDGLLRSDADIEDEALLTLREDSLTSHYNLSPHVVDGVVRLRGQVADQDDADHALSIVGEIAGVVDVVDDIILDPNLE